MVAKRDANFEMVMGQVCWRRLEACVNYACEVSMLGGAVNEHALLNPSCMNARGNCHIHDLECEIAIIWLKIVVKPASLPRFGPRCCSQRQLENVRAVAKGGG